MANKFFGAIDLIGGTDGALDTIDDAVINDLDGAYVIDSTQRVYTYNLDATSGLTEDSPRIIEPNSGSNKRWLLNTMVAKSLVVSENAEYVYGTDTGENEEGILRINASDDTEVRAQSGNSVDIIVSATKVADFAAAGLTLASGATIDEFGTDGTLAGNEDTVVPTEKATKTYADAVATTAAGLVTTHEADTSTHGVTTIAGLTEVQTMTNKTLTSPAINTPTGIVKGDVGLGNVDNTSDATKNAAAVTLTNKTLTSPVLNTGLSGTAFLDEDNMASNSATKAASQQSIKAYVDTKHAEANSIDSNHYVDGSIDSVHIGNDQIDSQHYAADSIDAEHYAPGSVDVTAMAANSVDSAQYVDGSIDRVHLAADIVDGTKIADNAVNSEHIAAGAIDLAHMSVNSIDSNQYVDGSIDKIHLAADIIDGTKLADNAVNSEHIAAGAIDFAHMSANSIDSDQYVDGSIDLIHMSVNSIDSDQYVDGSIDLIHMSANSVDSDQYVDGSIDLIHMSANSVDSNQYVDGSIDAVHLAANVGRHPGATNFFVAATHVFFAQATPPTGWTTDSAHKDNVLACKSDAGTYSVVGANKGSWTYTGFTKDAHVHAGPSHTHTTGDVTLTAAQSGLPEHRHTGPIDTSFVGTDQDKSAYGQAGSGADNGVTEWRTQNVAAASAASAHNHGATGAEGTGNTGAQSDAGITHDGTDRPYATVGVIATYTS